MEVRADQVERASETAKARKVNLPLRITPEAHDALRRIAFEERVSLHSLLLEGVAEVLRKRGS